MPTFIYTAMPLFTILILFNYCMQFTSHCPLSTNMFVPNINSSIQFSVTKRHSLFLCITRGLSRLDFLTLYNNSLICLTITHGPSQSHVSFGEKPFRIIDPHQISSFKRVIRCTHVVLFFSFYHLQLVFVFEQTRTHFPTFSPTFQHNHQDSLPSR